MTDPNIISLPDAHDLEREAANWFVRFDGDEATDADRQAFQDWYGNSQQHRDAFERMSAFWGGSGVLDELKDLAVADDMADLLHHNSTASRTKTTRRVFVGAIAASVMAVCGVGVTNFILNIDRDFAAQYATAIGEQETIDLPDGSQVILNTDSAFDVAFEDGARKIHMSKGEAFFNVAPDPNRPFSVLTDNGIVTAVGTAFSVRVHADKIDVLVTEGRVSLTAVQDNVGPDNPMTPALELPVTEISAGQSIEFAQTPKSIEIIEEKAAEKTLDWQDGIISFNGETLEQVIAELSRYTDMTIDITDDALRQQKIVAYYRVGEIEPMLDALNLMANVEVERISDRHVKLYRVN